MAVKERMLTPHPDQWVDLKTRKEQTGNKMVAHNLEAYFTQQNVTYVLETEGRLFVIENVPVRVSEETGEQSFSPETVERLQQTVRAKQKPMRVLEAPVYELAA